MTRTRILAFFVLLCSVFLLGNWQQRRVRTGQHARDIRRFGEMQNLAARIGKEIFLKQKMSTNVTPKVKSFSVGQVVSRKTLSIPLPIEPQ